MNRIFAAQGLDGKLRLAIGGSKKPIEPSIGTRCPSCNSVAESPVISGTAVLTQELRELHPHCDHKELLEELNNAIRELAEYFDWKEL